MSSIVDDQHLSAARLIGKLVATWNEIEDLVNIGAYVPGSNPEFDTVIQTRESVLGFLQQSISERSTIAQTRKRLVALGQEIRELQARLTQEKAGRRVPAAADGS
jgi:flagellar biosynthesis/type III secretory pathway ATPase